MRTSRGPSVVAVTSPRGTVCTRCELADGPVRRFVGLMGRRRLSHGEGLLLKPAASVHTCFMRFPIDVVFLGRELEVLGVSRDVRPWRATMRRRAKAVLELPVGGAESITEGDRLTLVEEAGHGR